MEFPPYIRQAGKKKVDIMLNPSYDIPKSTGPCNTLRLIENGFSLVRPVYNGYSYAMDYNGKLLAHMDSDRTEDGIMYADVPTKGARTIYSIIGDLFAWLCVLGFLGFIVVAIRERMRTKMPANSLESYESQND
jgi:apolipoprotein N-acyltransferase